MAGVRGNSRTRECFISDAFAEHRRYEGLSYLIEYDEVEQVVDNAIRLVRKIETKVYGNTDRLLWLKGRGDDGQFPDDSFA